MPGAYGPCAHQPGETRSGEAGGGLALFHIPSPGKRGSLPDGLGRERRGGCTWLPGLTCGAIRCAIAYMVSSRFARPRVLNDRNRLLSYIRPLSGRFDSPGPRCYLRVSSSSPYRSLKGIVAIARFSIRRFDLWCHLRSPSLRNRR